MHAFTIIMQLTALGYELTIQQRRDVYYITARLHDQTGKVQRQATASYTDIHDAADMLITRLGLSWHEPTCSIVEYTDMQHQKHGF